MLDTDTKRRIDTARDILVGKVPDPKSQVEQITIALIYKFMDDIDADSEELGGARKFFAGEFAKYGWAKLISVGLGGYDILNLYAEAIGRMRENPGIPPLFRSIFENAYLPYRDPETLHAFLKVIDEFTYDHSERLGDAFEYLLAVMDAQGDAGQFRTPRHIIDFIVAIVDPKKGETVLDPACGTAGFLISSYKHILNANIDGQDGQDKEENNPVHPVSPSDPPLTPDEREQLAANFKGYDISPDMVRLSLVNMYLHGFAEPHIFEYDTLTSDDRWNEHADVILANPPFMSPKGGIRPHNRFSVQSKRSEVLFVDYMAEHLTPTGRAGIIVPEGIIFQSQKAHTQLRKKLVEDYLVAVVSLPAGVFQPYSGVKTSILIFDRALARRTDRIAFFKVENDGYDLGAQRRPIDRNDLPRVAAAVKEYMHMDGKNTQDKKQSCPSCASMFDELVQQGAALIVAKDKLAANDDYNLSAERYRQARIRASNYELVPFKEVCTLEYGSSLPKKKRVDGPYPVIGSNGITGFHNEYLVAGPAIIVGRKGSAGEVTYCADNCFPIDTTYYVKLVDAGRTDFGYLYHMLKTLDLPSLRDGAGIPGLNRNDVYSNYELPLPPLSVQQEIVSEIEGYQRVIDGARSVIENYRPHIAINPDWPLVGITDVVANEPYSFKAGPFGSTLKKSCYVSSGYKVYGQEQVIRGDAKFGDYYIDEEKYVELQNCKVKAGDVLISLVGTYGRIMIVPDDYEPGIINPRLVKITLNRKKMLPDFFASMFGQEAILSQVRSVSHGGTMNILSVRTLKSLRIPLPSLKTQQAIVAEIEAEQALVAANRELIERFQRKIAAAIGRVWGES